MADCCAPRPTDVRCPVDASKGSEVPWRTVLLHLKVPRRALFPEQTYYFCENPDCEAVYFGADGTVIGQQALRTIVGVKSRADDAPLCYCFGISRGEAAEPGAREYVIEQTRRRLCACETANPAGRCCLRDFPRSGT